MNIQAAVPYKLGEYLGAGMFENESATIVERYALGIRRYFENVTPPQETGLLYPAPEDLIWSLGGKYIRYHYSNSLDVDGNGLYEYGKKFSERDLSWMCWKESSQN